jgi:hypothetical protein
MEHFLQLFCLYVLVNGHYIPSVFSLFITKQKSVDFFSLLCKKYNELELLLKPKIVAIDFEITM